MKTRSPRFSTGWEPTGKAKERIIQLVGGFSEKVALVDHFEDLDITTNFNRASGWTH